LQWSSSSTASTTVDHEQHHHHHSVHHRKFKIFLYSASHELHDERFEHDLEAEYFLYNLVSDLVQVH
jgi:hypothetical protein